MKKIISLGLGMILILSGCGNDQGNTEDVLSMDDAKSKVATFINDKLLPPDSKEVAIVDNIKEENGLYSMDVIIADKTINSYMTKDGDKFFPQVIDMNEEVDDKADSASKDSTPSSVVSNKTDKPVVDVFVMSHCPYGTQIEKGVLPVVDLLGDKADINIKFCTYAMHQKKELDEQMIQYCIDKEQGDKFWGYLECFLKDADSSAQCVKDNGVDKAKLDACVASTDKEFKVTENFNNKETWNGRFPSFNIYKAENEKFGIAGSPGLVINGEKVQSGRSPSDLLNVICSAFTDKPAECEEKLSSNTPAPGFGGGTGADTNASCN